MCLATSMQYFVPPLKCTMAPFNSRLRYLPMAVEAHAQHSVDLSGCCYSFCFYITSHRHSIHGCHKWIEMRQILPSPGSLQLWQRVLPSLSPPGLRGCWIISRDSFYFVLGYTRLMTRSCPSALPLTFPTLPGALWYWSFFDNRWSQ